MFFRVTSAGGKQYLQVARSYRDGGRVKQQTLLSLGRLDVLIASGQLEDLLRSGLRLCDRIPVVDAASLAQSDPASVLRIGPDLVFSALWEATGIRDALLSEASTRRFGFDVERAVYLTVLHRLFVSGSDRAAERWREAYRIPGTERLQLQHLYRAMGFLGTPVPEGPATLGSPRCVKDRIEERLFERRRDLFTQVDLVFFDTTSIHFEGAGGESLGRRGFSKNKRPDLNQMIVGMALDAEGWPLCCEMWPGNTTDVNTLVPVVERMRTRFRVREMCVLADRGMMSESTVAALEASDPPVRYILGARMRNQIEVRESVLRGRGAWQLVQPERASSKDPAPLQLREVRIEDRRYIVCLNEEERRKDAHDREMIVASLREKLRKGPKRLVGNKGYRRFLRAVGPGALQIDEQSVEQDARFDGIWVLRTNTDYESEVVARAYKSLWMVEDIFRTTKSILETRPIYHKRDSTIRGHVFCSFLALLLKRELERRLDATGESWEWGEVQRGLDNLHQVEALFNGHHFRFRSKLLGDAGKATRAAGVALPPTVEQID